MRRISSCPLLAAAITVHWTAALAKETTIDAFERAEIAPWTFSNGSEFPGATGALALGAGLSGKGAHLSYDLSGGGHYVAANLTFAVPLTAAAIAYSVRVPAGIHVRLRVVDDSDQTLQYDVNRPLEAYEGTKWYREVVALDAPSGHFGGANDGVLHQPLKGLSFLAADPPEPGAIGAIDFDDVVALDALTTAIDPRRREDFPALGVATLSSRLGVNIHFTKDDRALDLTSAAGFTWVRMDLGWGGVERTKGSYDFSALDGLVASLATRKLGLLLILDYMNPLYPGADASDFATVTVPAFAAMAKAAAAHYSGKDVRFEIWNEPNLAGFWPPRADALQYAALAKATISAVHAGDGAAKVTTAGISGFDYTYLRRYLSNGGGDGADAIGVHPYRQNAPESASDDLLLMRSIVSAKFPQNPPVWSTEWGYSSTWYGDGHATSTRTRQAVLAVRELLTAWALDAPVAVYYDVRDDGTDPMNAEHNFGLLGNDYSAKPAYTAVKTLTAFAEGKLLRGFYDVAPSSLHAMRIEGTGPATSIVWSDAPGSVISVTVPAGTTATDMLGIPVATTVNGSNLSLVVRESDGPVYLSTPTTGVADAGADAGVPVDASTARGGATGAGGRTGGGATSTGGSAGAVMSSGTGGSVTSGAAGRTGTLDAGRSGASGNSSTDRSRSAATDSSGCGCSVPRARAPHLSWLACFAAISPFVRRRRTARSAMS